MNLRNQLRPVSGTWSASDQINVWNVRKREIYRFPTEPGYVSWALLWKEADGTLKLSFTEATGDPAAWPPVLNFNSRDIRYYLKTLMSTDGGETWTDPDWHEDLDNLWESNSDHHVRHVVQMPDGTLLRNYTHTIEGMAKPGVEDLYDESKALTPFPFRVRRVEGCHYKFGSVWQSVDRGQTWEQIHIWSSEPPFFPTAFHQLRNGSIVAAGAIEEDLFDVGTYLPGMSESSDGGQSWSEPQVIAEYADRLAPDRITEESDFVELPDGRLLVIQRIDGAGMNIMQAYLTRDESGKWRAGEWTKNPRFRHGGYPHMHMASDGTIFYYSIWAILYSCDDGASWHSVPTQGFSYYGQLVESSPGCIVAVTQNNIQDCPYPWYYDASMHQTTFEYARTGVAEQSDADALGAVAEIGDEQYEDFHICAEIRADGETGLAFCVRGDNYGFAALVIPCDDPRAPDGAVGKEQDALLVVGKVEAGQVTILRRIWAGKVVRGQSLDRFDFPHTTWIEMQLDMSGGLLKAAVKTSDGDYVTGSTPPTYAVVRDDFGGSGKLGLFTNGSTGAFKNIHIGSGGGEIHSQWGWSSGGVLNTHG